MANVFDEMGKYWAEIADRNHTERQNAFLGRQLPKDGYVLDLACGSGRHMISLVTAGFEVVGLDVSFRLLRIAKQRGAGILVRGDIRYLPFKQDVFKAVVSMDTSFGYLPSEIDDAHSLVEIRRVLKREGELLIDVFNRERLISKYLGKSVPSRCLEYPSFSLDQKRSVSEDGVWLSDVWTIKDRLYRHVSVFQHKVRLYKRKQLELLLSDVGFSIKSILGHYEMQQFSPESPRLIILAYLKSAQ
jgi:ubiquinone/menaquinone biosynthesis C-methylase UbiE